jgi:hypothetical protein
MAVKMLMLVFWVVTPCVFSPEDEGSFFLENVGIYLQVHMALLPRRPTLLKKTVFNTNY